MLTFVKDDLFGITKRLRSVGREYHLFFNNRFGRYEVHNRARPSFQTLCFISPFELLDERTLEYAYKTKVENFDELEKEFYLQNKQIEQSAKKSAQQSAAVLSDMMQFAGSQVHEVVFCKSSKWF